MFDFLLKFFRPSSNEVEKADSTAAPSDPISAPTVPKTAPVPASPTPPKVLEAPTDDLAIIAVIAAAISAASGRAPSSFRVVSFKRANNKFSYGK